MRPQDSTALTLQSIWNYRGGGRESLLHLGFEGHRWLLIDAILLLYLVVYIVILRNLAADIAQFQQLNLFLYTIALHLAVWSALSAESKGKLWNTLSLMCM